MRELVTTTKSSAELKGIVNQICSDPEAYNKEPFQILDNIYYVGNEWVGAYLIDTGDGLALLDSNFPEVLPILLRNIEKTGHFIKDIRWLFLSHGHFDHIGGAAFIQAMSGCEIWFSPEELFMLKERRDLIGREISDFRIDHLYEFGKEIVCGNTSFTPLLSSGHTVGCTSLIIKTPFKGETVTIGAHGGLGLNGLTKKELKERHLPPDMALRYLHSLEELQNLPIQVFLPLHNAYYDIFSLAKEDNGDHSVFIQPNDWKGIMKLRMKAVRALIAKEQ